MSYPVDIPNINAGKLIWKPEIPISFAKKAPEEIVFKRGVAKLRVSMLGDLKLRIRISLDGRENYEYVVPDVHPKFVLRELKFKWAEDKVILEINSLNVSSGPRDHRQRDHKSAPLAVIVTLPVRDRERS